MKNWKLPRLLLLPILMVFLLPACKQDPDDQIDPAVECDGLNYQSSGSIYDFPKDFSPDSTFVSNNYGYDDWTYNLDLNEDGVGDFQLILKSKGINVDPFAPQLYDHYEEESLRLVGLNGAEIQVLDHFYINPSTNESFYTYSSIEKGEVDAPINETKNWNSNASLLADSLIGPAFYMGFRLPNEFDNRSSDWQYGWAKLEFSGYFQYNLSEYAIEECGTEVLSGQTQ